MADTCVFFFVGILAVFIDKKSWSLAGWIILFCLLGRVLGIVPMGALSNAVKSCVSTQLPAEKKYKLSWKHMVMICHGGLRGGIALVLALELGPWVNAIEGFDAQVQLRNATVILICVYLLVFGGTTELCLKRFNIPMGDAVDERVGLYNPDEQHGVVWKWLKKAQENVVIPLLVGSSHVEMHMAGGVVTAVLAKAVQNQKSSESRPGSEPSARDDCSDTPEHYHSDMFDMFGTNDPAAEQEIADIGMRRRGIETVDSKAQLTNISV